RRQTLSAAAMPELSADFRTWTSKLVACIYYADDPAFIGKPREPVAQDYVYSLKRCFYPVNRSPVYTSLHDEGIVGLEALRDAALKTKRPFDYDREAEGLKAIDRYTIRIRLDKPR